ncbi:MAG: MBL fold metallo-hydrolase [Methylococcaceae bacterium]|nr:MBL fold metallo-hydrolase [Methylococcaceae bacterium]
MNKLMYPFLGLALSLTVTGCATFTPGPLKSSANALEVANIRTIEFSGLGKWYQFGQAPNPSSAWPQFDVSSYKATINYVNTAARVQITRSQTIEPDRVRPAPVEQKVDQYLNGSTAWNVSIPVNAAQSATATIQPTAVEERTAEILSTPQGFLRAALANNAITKSSPQGNTEVSFTLNGKYRYIGYINANGLVARIKTWIDNPVLGDTLVETNFSYYKDFDGVKFPGHITRTQGSYPVLDIEVSSVQVNPSAEFSVPEEVANAKPAITVKADQLAQGVHYLTGGSHHSVLIEQSDHVVLVEAPQHEERSIALITKIKEIAPNKPIKYVVNTHAHFDHAGGLRTFVDEGSVIVTEQSNKSYFQKVWAAPRSLNPDRLSKSKKPPKFQTFNEELVLSDGNRPIEIYSIAGNGHNDAFALVYLPNEKILVEADAYNPPAANAPTSTTVNPYTVNLYENIQKLNLDVRQIAALHGPRVVTLDDLRKAIAAK